MNIKDYIENKGLKFSDFHQTEAYETGVNTGVEFMENNVEFIEDIITAYHKTKIQHITRQRYSLTRKMLIS